MNRTEHILTCAAEECAEVAQRITKALRFGLAEVQPGQTLTNAERICVETKDLIALLIGLYDGKHIPMFEPTNVEVATKLAKVERFMVYARTQGALT